MAEEETRATGSEGSEAAGTETAEAAPAEEAGEEGSSKATWILIAIVALLIIGQTIWFVSKVKPGKGGTGHPTAVTGPAGGADTGPMAALTPTGSGGGGPIGMEGGKKSSGNDSTTGGPVSPIGGPGKGSGPAPPPPPPPPGPVMGVPSGPEAPEGSEGAGGIMQPMAPLGSASSARSSGSGFQTPRAPSTPGGGKLGATHLVYMNALLALDRNAKLALSKQQAKTLLELVKKVKANQGNLTEADMESILTPEQREYLEKLGEKLESTQGRDKLTDQVIEMLEKKVAQ